jgi:hypothetical protein
MRGGFKKYQGKPLQFFHFMTYVLTVILPFLIITGVAIILSQVRTPSYRLQRKNVITPLKMVLNGTASENDWKVFVGIPIRYDLELERFAFNVWALNKENSLEIRGGSETKRYLFTNQGLQEINSILSALQLDLKKRRSLLGNSWVAWK